MPECIRKSNGWFLSKYLYLFLVLVSGKGVTHAQLVITSPVNNQILQRDTSGLANIPVTVYSAYPYSKIEAHLVPIEQNPHPAKMWSFSQEQISQGFLSASLQAKTGWYKLTLLGFRRNTLTDSAIAARVGIGEVFLVAGNSNAMGLPDLGAKNTSEHVISFNATNKILNIENITVAPDEPMQIPAFDPIRNKNYIFPSGETSWYWGELGDMLYQKMKTPVLFLNAAWAAANSENYRDAASGKDAFNIYVGKKWPNRQPYSNIVNTLRYLNSWLGMRAVLWSHGENDAILNVTEDDYFNNIKTLIEKSRKESKQNAPWIIATNSASTMLEKPYAPVVNAQRRLSKLKGFNTYSGPNLDTIQIPRPAHGHFENISGGLQGLTSAATAWNRVLSDSVLDDIIPLQPQYAIHTGVIPSKVFPGASFTVPYRITGQHTDTIAIQAELLNDSGKFVAIAGYSNQSPITIRLPANLANGMYRLRLTALDPVLPGSITTAFYVSSALRQTGYVNTISALPVGTEIDISWLMAANPLLRTMVLQKTINGKTYSDLKSFDALDNENHSHVYTYADQNTGKGSIFYRLRLEYKTGEITYSAAVAFFRKNGPPNYIVFPNPVTDQQFYLRPAKPAKSFKCSVFDMGGREHPLLLTDREVIGLILARPLYHLPGGNYILRIVSDSGVSTQMIMFL